MTVSATVAIVALLLLAGFLLSALDRRSPTRSAGRVPPAGRSQPPRRDGRRGRTPGRGDR